MKILKDMEMKIVIIDNYDSFTYNLAHLVKELGATVDVLRNDRFEMDELEKYDKILLSPGPGVPEEAGLLPDVIRTYPERNRYWECAWESRLSDRYSAGDWSISARCFTAYRPIYG